MVETRAQERRRLIWEQLEQAPLPSNEDIPETPTFHQSYDPGDTAHRHRLPDTSPFEVSVTTHHRRKPL